MESTHSFEVVISGETWAKARGPKDSNPFKQRVVQQDANFGLQLWLQLLRNVT